MLRLAVQVPMQGPHDVVASCCASEANAPGRLPPPQLPACSSAPPATSDSKGEMQLHVQPTRPHTVTAQYEVQSPRPTARQPATR